MRPRNKYSRACSCRTPLPRTYYSTHSHTPPPGTPSALSPCCSNSADNRRIRAAERRLHAKRSGQRVTQYRGGVHIPHNFVNNPGCTTPHAAIPYTHTTNPAVNTSPLSHPRVDTLTHTHHTTPLRSTPRPRPRPRRTAARLGPFPPSHLPLPSPGAVLLFVFHSSLALTNKEEPAHQLAFHTMTVLKVRNSFDTLALAAIAR